jgi:hypothetical protein
LFCKVRGEKVIKGFLNNEPRYLEPILTELESGRNFLPKDEASTHQQHVVPWTERYVLLLWLSHLMLAPFPLESISGPQPSGKTSAVVGIELPSEAPGITLRVLTVCIERLRSASKERGAAANLLVRLCVRPDMQKLGMLHTLVKWSVSFFKNASKSDPDIHQCLGVLSFMSGLVTSATNEEIGPYLSAIYHACRAVLDQDGLAFVKSSAVARKLVVKISRNIVVHCLQPAATLADIDTTSVLEEVVEFLLEAVADGDTPVRYGASKALSIMTLKMDPEMAEEVVEAILGSLNESVYWQGSKRNLSGVNSLRWHGLTLTLSHLLYRKAISTSNLPEVLNALLLSLSFEQRSPTGGSIGTNVRDAACFGIWALSRRYATSDLLRVDTASIRACEHHKTVTVPQALAIELVTAACLDPAGNIRRGSSAALQELIGRHPDTIEEGIPLVQVVDFHAVGLRQRAMCDVSVKAGALHQLYWEALSDNMLGWRGTGSLDTDSRLFAAKALGYLSRTQSAVVVRQMSDQICAQLAKLRSREVEERQGLVSGLAALVNTAVAMDITSGAPTTTTAHSAEQPGILHLWSLLESDLSLDDAAFTSPALRPELTASSICNFVAAMAALANRLPRAKELPTAEVSRILNLCLTRHEESVLEAIIIAVPAVLSLLVDRPGDYTDGLVSSWLMKLENEASYGGVRCSGYAVALGAAFSVLTDLTAKDTTDTNATEEQRRIVQLLTFRCTSAVAIDARTIALRALGVLVKTSHQLDPAVQRQISTALHIALNDYTITERGDVGSLVRLEALETVRLGWLSGALPTTDTESYQQLYTNVLRLSLEKLDKVRTRASRVLAAYKPQHSSEDVSSTAYFAQALQMLHPPSSPAIQDAICLGLVTSLGMGSESVVQNARAALVAHIDTLPDTSADQYSLLTLMTCITSLLKSNIENDRVLIPLLETIAFLFDMQVLQRLEGTAFKYVPFYTSSSLCPSHIIS